MLCDNCLKNNATVHMTTFVNGQVKTVHLCGQCAAKKKTAVVMPWFSFNDFMSAFYDEEEQTPDYKCSMCGTTLESFKKDGKLGCVNCYKVFEDSILPVIKGIHMNMTHTGKRPGERVEMEPGKDSHEDVQQTRKEMLKAQLRQAVEVENFEEAARLRDEIALLEKEG